MDLPQDKYPFQQLIYSKLPYHQGGQMYSLVLGLSGHLPAHILLEMK
jgi:hypothetical protein